MLSEVTTEGSALIYLFFQWKKNLKRKKKSQQSNTVSVNSLFPIENPTKAEIRKMTEGSFFFCSERTNV